MFEGLKSVRELNLLSNDISELYAESFEALTNLESLHLAENKLVNIPANLLTKNVKLKRLVLTFNKIKSIDYHLFDYSPSLAQIEMGGNACTNGNMLMQGGMNSFKRSITSCITNFQRMDIHNLKLTLPDKLKNDFDEVQMSWTKLSEFSRNIHDTSRQLINSITLQMNYSTNFVELAVDMERKSLEAVGELKEQLLLLNVNGKYSLVEEFFDGKFIILLALQITSLILLLVTMSSIIYGMWQIKQKANSFQS